MTPEERLRAFEDKVLGADVPRMDGQVERGSGSRFSKMKPDQHLVHRVLEELVSADQAVTDAQRALMAAQTRLETAKAAADAHDPQAAPTPAAPEAPGFEE